MRAAWALPPSLRLMPEHAAVEAQGAGTAEENPQLHVRDGPTAEGQPVPTLGERHGHELLLVAALLVVVDRGAVDRHFELAVVPDLKLIDVVGRDIEKRLGQKLLVLAKARDLGPARVARLLDRNDFAAGQP